MASSSGAKATVDGIVAIIRSLRSKDRNVALGVIALCIYLFILTSQPPIAPAVNEQAVNTQTSHATSEVVHIKLQDGTFSTRTSADSTVAITSEE